MDLNYRVQGAGKPLIVLHGFLGSLDNWRTMSGALAQTRRVYSLDLRNHGRSPHSPAMSYPLMAEDVHEFISRLRLAGACVLGHSMGGKVAMQLATQFPDDAASLVVVDIAPRAYPPAHRPMLLAMRALDLAGCASFGAAGDALAPAVPDPAVRQFLLKNLSRDPEGRLRWRIGLDEIIENYDALTRPIDFSEPFSRPACFIRGGRSHFVEETDLPSIQRLFPGAEIVTVGNAGHWVHIEAPAEFLAAVSGFLSKNE